MLLTHRRLQQCTYLNTLHGGIFRTHSVAIALIPQREHDDIIVTVTQKGSIWNWNWFASVNALCQSLEIPYISNPFGLEPKCRLSFRRWISARCSRLRLNRSTRTLSCLATGLDIRSRKEQCKSQLALYTLQFKIIALHGCYAADICSYRRFWTALRSHRLGLGLEISYRRFSGQPSGSVFKSQVVQSSWTWICYRRFGTT